MCIRDRIYLGVIIHTEAVGRNIHISGDRAARKRCCTALKINVICCVAKTYDGVFLIGEFIKGLLRIVVGHFYFRTQHAFIGILCVLSLIHI